MFKIGDEVRVIHKGSEYSCWIVEDIVGMKGIVEEELGGDYCVRLENGASWYYPPESLELANTNTLTQSDLQFLESELRKAITHYSGMVEFNKRRASKFWEDCDKNDKDSLYYFERFSMYSKDHKSCKAKLNKLAALQAKVKRMKAV